MKKFFLLLIAILILFPVVSAVDFEFLKDSDSFDRAETLVLTVSGNFIDQITEDKVVFRRDHEIAPMIYGVMRVENTYYIYAELGNSFAGNYSVNIEDVRYMNGTQISEEGITIPFQITEDLADFSLSPGFISTEGDFSLEIQNLQPSGIEISIDSSDYFDFEDSFSLVSGELESVDFTHNLDANNTGTFLEKIKISSQETNYEVPIYFHLSDGETLEERDFDISFQPNNADFTFATNSESTRIVYLVNKGKERIEEINLSISSQISQYIKISPEEISSLNENSTQKIEITIESTDEEVSNLNGDIIAVSDNATARLTLNLNFLNDFTPENGEDDEDEKIITTCTELGGFICGEGESCSEDTLSTRDGSCCLAPGTCEESSSPSNRGRTIGWILVGLVVILVAWFFIKYKRARPNKDVLSLSRFKK